MRSERPGKRTIRHSSPPALPASSSTIRSSRCCASTTSSSTVSPWPCEGGTVGQSLRPCSSLRSARRRRPSSGRSRGWLTASRETGRWNTSAAARRSPRPPARRAAPDLSWGVCAFRHKDARIMKRATEAWRQYAAGSELDHFATFCREHLIQSVDRWEGKPLVAGLVWQARGGDRLREAPVSVEKALARDRELRTHATARPWHEDGHSIRLRLVGPLPRSTVVVDPYAPNPRDAPLLLHRVNTYEELEQEIERLRAWLRDVRARLDTTPSRATKLPGDQDFEALARDLRAGINAALGDRGVGAELASAAKGRKRQRG